MKAMKRLSLVLLAAGLAAASLPAWAETVLHRGNRGEPTGLDPQQANDGNDWQILQELFEGLVTPGPDGKTGPGMAESWTVSADGLTYTFKLRPNLKWSDGDALTAEDLVYSFRRLHDAKTGSNVNPILIRNGRAIRDGKAAPDTLGVTAVDPQTFEITLESAWAPFIDLLSATYFLPVPQHAIEANGEAWARPGKLVSNGAYMLSEWSPNEHVKITRNANFHDAAGVSIDTVFYYPLVEQATAFRRFRAGELDINSNYPFAELPWIKENLADSFKVDPAFGLQWLTLNNKKLDVKVRKAIQLAVDTETIVNKVMRSVDKPVTEGIVPEAFPDYPAVTVPTAGKTMEQRIAEARALMVEAGYGPDKPLKLDLRIKDRDTWKATAVALTAMLKEVYIDAPQLVADSATHDNALFSFNFDIAISGNVAAVVDPELILEFWRPGSAENASQYESAAFAAALDASRKTTDHAERYKQLHDAEQILIDDAGVVPLWFFSWGWLVKPTVSGWQESPRILHPTRYLSIAN